MNSEYTYYNKLKEDNIFLREPDTEILDYVTKKDSRLTNLTSKFIATRYDDINDVKDLYTHTLPDVLSKEYISGLPDVELASDIILKHMESGSKILLLSDTDSDGQNSAAVTVLIFKKIFGIDIDMKLSNKRINGYGINDTLTKETLEADKEKHYGLIMTSDHGKLCS